MHLFWHGVDPFLNVSDVVALESVEGERKHASFCEDLSARLQCTKYITSASCWTNVIDTALARLTIVSKTYLVTTERIGEDSVSELGW